MLPWTGFSPTKSPTLQTRQTKKPLSEDTQEPARRGFGGRRLFLLLTLVLASAGAFYLAWRLGWTRHRELGRQIIALGGWGYPLYFFIFAALTALGFPVSVLTVAAAIAFGTVPATILSTAGATAGGVAAFVMARHLGRDYVQRRLEGKARMLDERISKRGATAVLLLRILPVVPFNAASYAAGLTGTSLARYTIATAAGFFPGAFAYCFATNVALRIDIRDPKTWLRPDVLMAFGLVVLLSVVLPLGWRYWEKRHEGV